MPLIFVLRLLFSRQIIQRRSHIEDEATEHPAEEMAANQAENQLRISWHDSAWIPRLNGENVLDYFCQRTNPFYDRTCNNEVVKMQRLDPSQLQ